MALREYRQKRDFGATPEPEGKAHAGNGHRFVVQKHAASRLHYDFRLEMDGVLASWAVPKGPSLDPAEKRLAVQVEDHPLEYGDFEGVIPQGEYGGGTVLLWDRGQWTPRGDATQGFKSGRLKFSLDGEKLHGGWTLVRIAGDRRSSQPNWLLMKERDDQARPLSQGDILEELPESVKTGRSLEEIAQGKKPKAAAKQAKRQSAKKPAKKSAKVSAKKSAKRTAAGAVSKRAAKAPGAILAPLPRQADVQLATLVDSPPAGDDWLHEMKFDGYRMLCRVENGRAKFTSRNHQDWTERLARLAEAAAGLPVKTALLDGEVAVLDERGVSSFQDLQNAFKGRSAAAPLVYCVFDLLHLDGYDLRKTPLVQRKELLQALLDQAKIPSLRYSEHIVGAGPEFLREACKNGLEGVISKRRDSAYSPGRGGSWLKSKCRQGQELVVGGFTDPQGSRTGIGSLMLGYYQDGQLLYAGRVGTGFDRRMLADLRSRLEALERKTSPFAEVERSERSGAHWVSPELVAQIEFANWTSDGRVRQAVFLGLREDKPAHKVTREAPSGGGTRTKPSRNAASRNGASRNGAASNGDSGNGASRKQASKKQASPRRSADASGGVKLTNPDRVLFPESGITKQGLADYYAGVAAWLLPHVVDRPLALVRCPEGRQGACFFQKRPPQGLSKAVRRVSLKIKHEAAEHLVVDDLEGVLALVQFGALELHVWGARVDDLDQPDRIIFDLDPDEALPWKSVVEAAELLRSLLDELGWRTFVKTTGGKGLHVAAPIARRHPWPLVKAMAKAVAELFASAAPDRYTSTVSKSARRGKIFIDYLRNDRGATSVAALSTRARPGAPVSMPLAWEELADVKSSRQFTVENALAHLESRKHDPWAEIGQVRQSITSKIRQALRIDA